MILANNCMPVRARSHLKTMTLLFLSSSANGSICNHATHFFLSSEMSAAPIPNDKNMHRCRQVRMNPNTLIDYAQFRKVHNAHNKTIFLKFLLVGLNIKTIYGTTKTTFSVIRCFTTSFSKGKAEVKTVDTCP